VPAGEEDEAEPTGTLSDGLPVEVRETVVSPAAHAGRLDRLLVELAPEFSRSHLQRLVEGGHVQVDGRGVTQPSRRLRVGGRVRIELVPTAEALAFRPERLPIVSVFEDPFIRVIDKPAGLVVHPAAGNWSGTLLNGLLHLDPVCAGLPRAGIVHRLDKDTSGLMVVGRTLEAVTGLVRMIAARTVRREYLAVAHCAGERVPAQVEAPIGRDPRSRLRMAVVPAGKPARTDFEPVALAPGYAAVRCRLHTGRTHQIRVHLAHSRLPLVGDLLYGGVPAFGIRRQALHAHRLRFEHPVTGQTLDFESDPPADFSRAWEQVVGRAPRGTI
jgi:23S rRNA pseudouridine1911/1915/1917 synthase